MIYDKFNKVGGVAELTEGEKYTVTGLYGAIFKGTPEIIPTQAVVPTSTGISNITVTTATTQAKTTPSTAQSSRLKSTRCIRARQVGIRSTQTTILASGLPQNTSTSTRPSASSSTTGRGLTVPAAKSLRAVCHQP